MRMLQLSGLDADAMTDDQRDAFINMAENLGIEPGDAEDMVDLYLEELEEKSAPPPSKPVVAAAPKAPAAATAAHLEGSLRAYLASGASEQRRG